MSRNPFRQARDRNEEVRPTQEGVAVSIFDGAPVLETQHGTAGRASAHGESKVSKKKIKKKVVIQTPPRSPEEAPRKLSLGRPPSPPLPAEVIALKSEDAEDSDSTATADSDLEQALINTRRNSAGGEPLQHPVLPAQSDIKAPFNPFARTLATNEEQYKGQKDSTDTQDQEERSRPIFDVDTFKNILLNGAAPPLAIRTERKEETLVAPGEVAAEASRFETRFPDLTTSTPADLPATASAARSDSSSDDELPEDPQTQQTVAGRSNLAPSQRASRPETVSFDSFDSQHTSSPSTLSPQTTNSLASSRDNGYDKPLPEPPRPEATAVTKASPAIPPPPPTTRRQGASRDSQTNHHRSSSVISRSSIQSDASGTTVLPPDTNSTKAPPPPPTRRAAQARSSQIIAPEAAPTLEKSTMSPPPAPAPRRAPSKVTPPSIDRTPSSTSKSSLQALSESPAPMASPGNVPKPPPPRRKAESNRSSVDGTPASRRTSGQDGRKSSIENANEGPRQDDILSNLAALQREVDELRAKAG